MDELNPYKEAIAVKKPAGAVLINGRQVGDTLRCVHCSAQWVHEAGSGKKRGFCVNCKGFLCGSPLCDGSCIPLNARLEAWEKGLTKAQALYQLDKLPKTILLSGTVLSQK